MTDSILNSHPYEVARALRTHRYDLANGGIRLSDSRVFVGGALKTIDYRVGAEELVAIDANVLLLQGLTYVLNVALPPTGGFTQISQWYIAPYSGNYTPDNGLTAATFPSAATEFTAYTSSTRLPLTIGVAATTPATGNTGAAAQLIFNSGGPYNVYGAAIVSASAKSATTGVALACVRLDNPKLGMTGGERLGMEYVITAADAD